MVLADAEAAMRVDKWLWAARLYKTRGAALTAIKGGKVHVGGERVKPSRLIRPGDHLELTRGQQSMRIVVNGLNLQRRPASEAQLLYSETEDSRRQREAAAEQRRQASTDAPHARARPTKRERRQIHRFTGKGQ